MTNPMNPLDNLGVASLTDDEMLDILRRVQSGELTVEQAEEMLSAASAGREGQERGDVALESQDFSAPLGKTANGKLVFERGVAGLNLHAEPLAGQLFTAHFERHVPVVRVNGGTVTIRYRDFGFGLLNWLRYGFKSPRSDVALNADIPWQVDIHGGIAQSHLDLHLVKLRKATIHSGVSNVELRLGESSGVVHLDCHGGVHNFSILRPAAVAVRLTVHGGAANLALDHQKFGAVSGMTTLETPNSQEASSQYVINVHGGAHNFKVATL
jgi:hypothetical protein